MSDAPEPVNAEPAPNPQVAAQAVSEPAPVAAEPVQQALPDLASDPLARAMLDKARAEEVARLRAEAESERATERAALEAKLRAEASKEQADAEAERKRVEEMSATERMQEQRPRFVVLEGIDGSGTTTQQGLIAERLRARGHRVHQTHEPSTGRIGELTRALLAVVPDQPRTVDAAGLALLFAADRLEHLAQEIDPALARGEVVICDRYVVSSWVYQSLDCDPAWVRTINERTRWPDLTFIFDLAPEFALARVASRRDATGQVVERFDVPMLQRRLAHGYAAILEDGLEGVVRVDASQSIEAVTEAILAHCIASGL